MTRLVGMARSKSGNLERLDRASEEPPFDHEDALMEEILANIQATPLGQVLRHMASLPEIRKGKVLRLRQEITDGVYDEDGYLDAALDRVLEDLTT